MKKLTITGLAAVAALTAVSGAQAATLNNGDVLTIKSGATTASSGFAVGSGSFFGMDFNTNFKISVAEATAITGLGGITVGATTADATTSNIDTWFFNNGWGSDYVTGTAVTGSTGAGLNMTGWTVNWGGANIPMGVQAWQYNTTNPSTGNIMALQTYTSGVGNFSWDGVYGDAYTLDYTATVPTGAPFAGTQYYLHLEGVVNAAPVPEASTYGMMLAGLGLVGFAVRRRKLVA